MTRGEMRLLVFETLSVLKHEFGVGELADFGVGEIDRICDSIVFREVGSLDGVVSK